MIPVYFYTLICLTMADGSACKPGDDKPMHSTRAYYSIETCEEDAKAIARGLFIAPPGIKYGYRCEAVTYDPPKIGVDGKPVGICTANCVYMFEQKDMK